MADMGSTPWLTPGQEDDSSAWIELGLEGLVSQEPPAMPVPFKLFAKRFKSSSPDAEWFLHHPVEALVDERAFTDAGFNRGWHVTTFVVNHHQTLSRIHLFAMAVVAPEEETVAVTIYKKNSGG